MMIKLLIAMLFVTVGCNTPKTQKKEDIPPLKEKNAEFIIFNDYDDPFTQYGTEFEGERCLPGQTPSAGQTTGQVPGQAAADIFNLTNQERIKNGLSALEFDPVLTKAAQLHAEDMGKRNYFGHGTPEGKTPTDRAAALGYTKGVAENIACGQRSAEEVVKAWMASPGHRANILNTQYRYLGVGYYYASGSTCPTLYVQNFSY